MDLATTKAYALPGNLSAGIGHGSWSLPLGPADVQPQPGLLNSNCKEVRHELQYSARDIEAVEEWVKRHVESTWHSLGTCSMAPREGNSIVKHGVLDERLNVHGVKGLKVADLSICPDNVGCKLPFGREVPSLVVLCEENELTYISFPNPRQHIFHGPSHRREVCCPDG